MNLALQRPQTAFYTKQATVAPKEVNKYEAWLKSQDKNFLGNIEYLAEEAAARKALNKPYLKPKLKGFERQYFMECMERQGANIAYDQQSKHREREEAKLL